MPLVVVSAAALSGHLELAPGFEWLGSPAALAGLSAAAVLEVAAYLVPFLDNALDALAGPAAAVAGTVLMASSVVEVDPLLRWTLAVVAGGGVASVIQLLTGITRLASTATTAGLGNPAVAASEAVGSVGVSLLAVAVPVAGAAVALALVALAGWVLLRGGRRLRGRLRL